MKLRKEYDPLYCLCEKGFERKTAKHYEGVFTQGSGYLHIRGSFEEGLEEADQDEVYMRLPANVTIEKPRHPLSKWGTYIPGITGIHPLLKEELVNLPYLLCFKVMANGKPLDMSRTGIRGHQRILDLRNGLLYREFDWDVDSETTIHCFYTRYVSAYRKNLVIQSMDFTVLKGQCQLSFISDIEEKVKTNGYNHFASLEKRIENTDCLIKMVTDNSDEVIMASRAFSDRLGFYPDCNRTQASVLLKENERITINKLSVVSTSKDNKSRNFESLKEQLDNAQSSFSGLYREHEKIWQALWNASKVEIEGDDRAQIAVNFSIYHLLRAANPENSHVAICAKGFAGEAYFGHFFWDTEIYLMPFYIYTRPAAAKALAEFRLNTLPGAKRNALSYGYCGAKYPWESSVSGDEQCPNWQYADHEIHITADVVFGLWHYYCASGDENFLLRAAPVFLETSRYWISRVQYMHDGSVSLNGVMGPDEYLCFTNNNAYTNVMVSWSLKKTLEVLKQIGELHKDFYGSLGVTLEELHKFKEVSEKLPVKTMEKNILLQCDGFNDLEEVDFDSIWPDKTKPFGHFVSQERNFRSKALKQADVLMLPFLFPGFMDKEQLAANYDYYYRYTTHDSSLSAIIHSILCSRMGRKEEAYRLFLKALDIDLSEEKSGAAEGIHIANCGGIWQAVIFGFAGMLPLYESEELSFSPSLPEGWKSLKFNFVFKGIEYRAEITHDGVALDRRNAE